MNGTQINLSANNSSEHQSTFMWTRRKRVARWSLVSLVFLIAGLLCLALLWIISITIFNPFDAEITPSRFLNFFLLIGGGGFLFYTSAHSFLGGRHEELVEVFKNFDTPDNNPPKLNSKSVLKKSLCETPQHQANHGDLNHGFTRLSQVFVIFAQPTTAT